METIKNHCGQIELDRFLYDFDFSYIDKYILRTRISIPWGQPFVGSQDIIFQALLIRFHPEQFLQE